MSHRYDIINVGFRWQRLDGGRDQKTCEELVSVCHSDGDFVRVYFL